MSMDRKEELGRLTVVKLKTIAKRVLPAGTFARLRKEQLIDAIVAAEQEEKKSSVSVKRASPSSPKEAKRVESPRVEEKKRLADRIAALYTLDELKQLVFDSRVVKDQLEEINDTRKYSEEYTRSGYKDVVARRDYCSIREEPDCPPGSVSRCMWNPDGFHWVCEKVSGPRPPSAYKLPEPTTRETFL